MSSLEKERALLMAAGKRMSTACRGGKQKMGRDHQQQNAAINHSSSNDIVTGYDIVIGSTSMSSASDSSPSSLETVFRRVIEGSPDKEDNVIIVDEKTSCEAEKVLVENCNRLSALYTLCIGLETTAEDGATKPLLDFDDSAFKNLKKKDIKPSVDFLREEVTRRSLIEGSVQKIPKPKGWTFSKCLQFLVQHPITGADEIAFLKTKVQEILQVVNEASKADDDDSGKKWVGQLPYLRLIHCLLEDDVKDKWIHRNDPKTIQEIDARNSDARVENAYEMISSRWNSNLFNPKTMVSSCHYDFMEEINIGYDACLEFVRATPTKVKDKLAKMKTDLTTIIEKWERSGQGDGGIMEEKDDDDEDPEILDQVNADPQEQVNWGRSKGRTGAFDCRESFLGPNPSYLLYFWDVLDKTDLFNTTMNRLSDDIGVSSPNQVPGIISTAKNSAKTNNSDDVSVFISSFRNVIVEASEKASIAADRRHKENKEDQERRHKESQVAQDKRVVLKSDLANKSYLKRRIDTLQDEARNVRLKIFECQDEKQTNKEQFFTLELKKIEDEIEKCNVEMEKEL
jgi:hypothetical protein